MAPYSTGGLLNGMFSGIGGNGRGGNPAPASGVPKTGQLLYSDATVNLAATSTPKIVNNIAAPNKYPAHNWRIHLSVTDTTGATPPTGVNSIESVLQFVTISGASGKVLARINGENGEFERWQHLLNSPNMFYSTAGTPADTSASTPYNALFDLVLQDWIVPNNEFPISVRVDYNTLASRATTPNSMTSQVVAFEIWCDFVPLSSGSPTMLRTKLVNTGTGIVDYGVNVDRDLIYAMALDVAADSNLSHTNTFNLEINGNSLINNSDYQTIITQENSQYPITTPHISGFFPFGVLYKGTIDGTQKITLDTNITTAPTIGGNANSVNLYMLEAYQ